MSLINQRLCDQQTYKSLSSTGVQDYSYIFQVPLSVPFPQCVTLSKPKVGQGVAPQDGSRRAWVTAIPGESIESIGPPATPASATVDSGTVLFRLGF